MTRPADQRVMPAISAAATSSGNVVAAGSD